ncbi:MAG: hypothetical protein HYT70_02110 [Candidatus Aenigmarchaeota archaeon]|nr:hypothetical protein [Candidatus Aenigmarchaeota archaeon]
MAYGVGGYSRKEHMVKLLTGASKPGYKIVGVWSSAREADLGPDYLVLWKGERRVAALYDNRFDLKNADEEEKSFLRDLYFRMIGIRFV